jgi:tRNA dimethylallyltransferase
VSAPDGAGRAAGSDRDSRDQPVPPRLIVVAGATGTGKSDLGVAIARRVLDRGIRAEVVNADAMQLYRGMDIGTAKLTMDEREGVPHRQLDVLDVTDEASVAAYQRAARTDIERVVGDEDDPGVAILVGGSGLYVSSVVFDLRFPGADPELRSRLEQDLDEHGLGALHARLRELDPGAAAAVDARNPRRVIRALEVASRSEQVQPSLPTAPTLWRPARIVRLSRDRSALVASLAERARRMFDRGLIDETAALIEQGLERGRTARAAIGYSQALDVVRGRSSVEDAVEATALATRKYARRQVSWFKRYDAMAPFDEASGVGAETIDVTGADRTSLGDLARRIVP